MRTAQPSHPLVLALDTCLGACSVALVRGERTLAALSEPMTRGHQERLAPMVRELMTGAAAPFSALDRIGVTVGPGSFTGLRVGLAFAKGLGLALGRPVVGVGVLHALAQAAAPAGSCAAVIDAGRGRFYLQLFEAGEPLGAAETLSAGRDPGAGDPGLSARASSPCAGRARRSCAGLARRAPGGGRRRPIRWWWRTWRRSVRPVRPRRSICVPRTPSPRPRGGFDPGPASLCGRGADAGGPPRGRPSTRAGAPRSWPS